MKILLSTVLALSVLAAWPAAAQRNGNHGYRGHNGGGRMDAQMQQQPGGYQRQPQRAPQRDFQRFNPPPDQQRFNPPPDRRHDGRMTDDERRDLHRDLDRANREIYKGRR